MRTYIIHLIRHAKSEKYDEGRYIGHTDVSLSQTGKEELIRIRDEYGYPEVESVFTSPLKRCTETAALIYPEKSAIVIEDLSEMNFGEFEGKTAEELKSNEAFAGWLEGKNAPPFGETSKAFGSRICSSFEKIVNGMMKSGVFSASVITHGGVIGVILAAYGLPQASVHEWFTPDCCGYTLRVDPALWMRNKKFEVFKVIPGEK